MLIASRVTGALAAQRDAFQHGLARTAQSVDLYNRELDRLERLGCSGIEDSLGGVPWPGARPLPEFDRAGLVVPFGHRWSSLEEARHWAAERLRGITTAAVDGSQIAAAREFGVPIALVQAAWFRNPHRHDTRYVKDIRDKVLLPAESLDDPADYFAGESRLHRERYLLEMTVLAECIEALSTDAEGLALHDGSLVLSFIGRVSASARAEYLAALFQALDSSRRCRRPLVAYVDYSLASDLVTMVRTAGDLPAGNLHDSRLLLERMEPLDRTAAFLCARGDILPQYRTEAHDYSTEICFLYLKVGPERPPVRIEFPRWVVDDDLVDGMIDVIRAEVVAGGGYPYALEAADAAAVLTVEDRAQFYRLWHEFAAGIGADTILPAKSRSKAQRR